ncbi:MAG: hypothetical protein V9F82_07830 [Dermatophilaceae bacterium]
MDVDASQYASISMEMMQNGSWLAGAAPGRRLPRQTAAAVLDVCGISFAAVWAVSNWAYKLPSLLGRSQPVCGPFTVLPCCFIPRKRPGRRPSFWRPPLGVSHHLQRRTHRYPAARHDRLRSVATGRIPATTQAVGTTCWARSFCVGLAMLAKGPIGLVIAGFAVGAALAADQRDWRGIFTLAMAGGIGGDGAACWRPMCWGLYQQFDAAPGEGCSTVETGVSGLYFFFLGTKFRTHHRGRTSWQRRCLAVLFPARVPMGFFALVAAADRRALDPPAARVFRQKFRLPAGDRSVFHWRFSAHVSWPCRCRDYKLPHYIFVTLPWAAVLLAAWLNAEGDKKKAENSPSIIPAGWGDACLRRFPDCPCHRFPAVGFCFSGNLPPWVVMITGTAFLLLRIVQNPLKIDSDVFVQRGIMVALLTGFTVNYHLPAFVALSKYCDHRALSARTRYP